jgi:hypothetical protein
MMRRLLVDSSIGIEAGLAPERDVRVLRHSRQGSAMFAEGDKLKAELAVSVAR